MTTQARAGIVTIDIPFHALVSDNQKFTGGRGHTLTQAYRRAFGFLHNAVKDYWTPRDSLEHTMALRCVMYPPDKRRRDAGNYRKLVTDALNGTVYVDDSQLVSETWQRGPVDKKNPRFLLTLEAAPDPDEVPNVQ